MEMQLPNIAKWTILSCDSENICVDFVPISSFSDEKLTKITLWRGVRRLHRKWVQDLNYRYRFIAATSKYNKQLLLQHP